MMAAQVALRRQQAQEEAEAKEMGIGKQSFSPSKLAVFLATSNGGVSCFLGPSKNHAFR